MAKKIITDLFNNLYGSFDLKWIDSGVGFKENPMREFAYLFSKLILIHQDTLQLIDEMQLQMKIISSTVDNYEEYYLHIYSTKQKKDWLKDKLDKFRVSVYPVIHFKEGDILNKQRDLMKEMLIEMPKVIEENPKHKQRCIEIWDNYADLCDKTHKELTKSSWDLFSKLAYIEKLINQLQHPKLPD